MIGGNIFTKTENENHSNSYTTTNSRTNSTNQSQSINQNITSSVDSMDLAGQERSSIMQALEQTRWNKTAAAKLLGLSLRQLRYRLQKLDIE